jgi:hypothetical protein
MYWEIIADNLSKAGWSWGCVSAVDSCGRTTFVADAHRGDGKRFVVRANESLFIVAVRVCRDAGLSKNASERVTRRFNESSAALKTFVGELRNCWYVIH